MPLYDYKCKDHGLFHALATMADSDKPAPCPSCGKVSSRIIMLPPQILDMAPGKRKAHETNERSQHEPVISSTESRHEAHNRGCGCEIANPKKSALLYTADGKKMFPSMRPWMISH